MNLPVSETLDIKYLSRLFDNKSESYKLFWFKAIMGIVAKGRTSASYADFRYTEDGFDYFKFRGTKWNHINQKQRQRYLKNAYRVLLTRARQGLIIYVPEGSDADPSRKMDYYDRTFQYLKSIGIEEI